MSYIRSQYSDLKDADIVYHKKCRTNFSSPSLKIPEEYRTTGSTSKGRPSNDHQSDAFLQTVEYFKENDDGKITVANLSQKMGEYLQDMGSESQVYSNKYLQIKLCNSFGKEPIISSADGLSDTLTLKSHVALRTFKLCRG